jgi:hypothetical protein
MHRMRSCAARKQLAAAVPEAAERQILLENSRKILPTQNS